MPRVVHLSVLKMLGKAKYSKKKKTRERITLLSITKRVDSCRFRTSLQSILTATGRDEGSQLRADRVLGKNRCGGKSRRSRLACDYLPTLNPVTRPHLPTHLHHPLVALAAPHSGTNGLGTGSELEQRSQGNCSSRPLPGPCSD